MPNVANTPSAVTSQRSIATPPNNPTDIALLGVSQSNIWNLVLNDGPLRDGTYPKMSGDRYGNQPAVGLGALLAP